MDIASSLVTASDIQRQTKELCRINPPGHYNPEHLPAELKKEQESLERQMLYHLGQAMQLYQTKGNQLNDSVLRWYETAYYHHPSDLIGDAEWQNFYPAIILVDRPYRTFAEAVAASEEDQRYLTTQLLRGTMTKKQQERLLHQAQKLVCTMDPRDKDFFSEETLKECLERERLATNKDINRLLNRKDYTPVTKADKRDALAQKWEARNEELKVRWRFEKGEWDGFELEAVESFTYEVLCAVAELPLGYCKQEFEVAIWEVLRTAEEGEGLDDYYLDPREEDTWLGLADFAAALGQVDTDAMHYDYQSRKYTAQQWVKAVGLPSLYGGQADWWAELPDLKIEENQGSYGFETLLTKSNRSPREEVKLFKGLFADRLRSSAISSLVRGKYGQRIKEVLSHA